MKILIQTNEMQEIASKVSAASFRKFGIKEDDIFFLNFNPFAGLSSNFSLTLVDFFW